MDTKKKIVLYLFLGIINVKCQKRKDTNITIENINKMNENAIEKVLEKQLKQGTTYTIDEVGAGLPKVQFEIQELDAMSQVVSNILKSNGFTELSNENFNQKIKNIFGRIINPNSAVKYLYLNYFNKCSREIIMYKNNGIDYSGTFIDKKRKIISDFYYIPEIIDYQRDFPKLIDIENIKILRKSSVDDLDIEIPRWKEVSNLKEIRRKNIQTLVARNMYLFNDNKAQFKWLILNDQYFMENLVKTFGYSEDKELLKWLLLKTLPENYSNYNKNIEKEFEKLLWTKNCDGSISIHQNTLEVLKDLSTPNKSDFILCLADYIQHGLCLGCDIDQREDLTFQQKSKIVAYLLEFGEQYKYNSPYNFNQMFLGNFYNYVDYNKNYIKEFEKNKFYGLKNLKNWYDKASVEENIFKNNDLPDNPQPIDYYYKSGK
ncbi:hypothetical protein [Chryseobacterium aquaticum]|uniref:hypothetical protein n=1 Tax=Chryseobacterium aquaticum TaxID=452084 RepID=UPI002FC83816